MSATLARRGVSHSACRIFTRLALCLLAACLFGPLARETRAQSSTGSPAVVVSQIYTRGGEAGATYTNDFIEVFNRSNQTVDLSQYSFRFETTVGSVTSAILFRAVSTRGIPLAPGQYFLIQLAGGPDGAPLPVTPDANATFFNLGLTGNVSVIRGSSSTSAFLCPVGQDPNIEDYVGYGTSFCFEGASGAAPTNPQSTSSATLRAGGGCTDTDRNGLDFSAGTPNPRNTASPRSECAPAPGPSVFQFSTSNLVASESAPSVLLTVTRTGDTSQPATVDYATTDGTATERQDYTTALGTLRFAAGEQSKTVNVLLADDGLPEGGDESFTVRLSNPTAGATLGLPLQATVTVNDNDAVTVTPNPVENSEFFVRRHYNDFFSREADAAGLQFWTGNIEGCGADAACRALKRIDTSAAFFLSIEFQQTGFLVHRMYRAAFGNIPGKPVPIIRTAFLRDTQQIGRGVVVGEPGWEVRLEANKRDYAEQFVARAAFTDRYPTSLQPAAFVELLNMNAGDVLPQDVRAALARDLESGAKTRAEVLRTVAESPALKGREFNAAFVLMQYFGYLQRDPDAAPDAGFEGFNFWLRKLDEFGGDYRRAEMVKSFITSGEYRHRFGL